MATPKKQASNMPKAFEKYEEGNKKGAYSEPRHDIDPKQKGETWHRNMAEAMFAKFIRENPVLPFSEFADIHINRLYARGQQSIRKYKDMLVPPETDANGVPVQLDGLENARKGYMNVIWEIFSFMPKFKAVVMGMFEDVDYDAKASAIDEVSGAERDEIKFNLWFESEYRDFLTQTREAIGMPQPKHEYLPRTKQELELFQNLGGIKLKTELGIERSLKYTFYISDWPEVKRKMIEDVFENNKCAAKDYYDPVDGKVKVRYVDIARLVHQYSTRRDYKNIDWAGEVVQYTISQLREETNLSEEELVAIGRQYIGYMDNPTDEDGYKRLYASRGVDNCYHGLDDFKIEVFDAEFITYNHKMRDKRTTASGEDVYDWDYQGNKKEKKTENRERIPVRLRMVHRVKLIIGTGHIFDWGPQYDIPRPTKKEANLSYHIYQLPGRSMTNMAIPNIDQIQLTFLKLQNALVMAAPPGVSIEVGSMEKITIGGKIQSPLDIMEIRRQTGDTLWRATTHKGVMSGYQGDPVKETDGGIGGFLNECIALFDVNFQFIRDITGISQFADASTPDKNQPVKTAMMALQGTNNALKNIFVAVATTKERVATNAAARIQMRVKYTQKAYEAYLPVMGTQQLQVFKLTPDMANAVFGITIELRPTEEMKQDLKMAALEMSRPGQNGKPSITYSDYLMIVYYLDKGEYRYAQALLSYKEKLNKEEERKIQEENMKMTGENNIALEQKRLETKQAEIDAQKKADIEIDTNATDNMIRLEAAKHQFKLEEILATPRPAPAIGEK